MDSENRRAQAWDLLCRYNQDAFHLRHAQVVEGVMRQFALKSEYAEEVDFWGCVGLLHDLDFEQFPQEHCIQLQRILREENWDERLIRACASHGYLLGVDIKPEHYMEKVLYATDELTGLIGAVAVIRPSKSLDDLEARSVLKKFKNSQFAAGCSREVIERGAEMLSLPLVDLVTKTIEAMKDAGNSY